MPKKTKTGTDRPLSTSNPTETTFAFSPLRLRRERYMGVGQRSSSLACQNRATPSCCTLPISNITFISPPLSLFNHRTVQHTRRTWRHKLLSINQPFIQSPLLCGRVSMVFRGTCRAPISRSPSPTQSTSIKSERRFSTATPIGRECGRYPREKSKHSTISNTSFASWWTAR